MCSISQNINYIPFECRIISIKELTHLEKSFRFERLDGKSFDYQPGQFMQLSLMGVGEAPISISSSPTRGNYIEMGVRNVGALTKALHSLKKGSIIGMRGPFGTSFPIADLGMKDLILIAGGCGLAPLRSLIQYVEDRFDDFGIINILYGAKSPRDLMYRDEIENWQKAQNFFCQITVDKVSDTDSWDGNVGLITKLIPKLEIKSDNTVAVICGPPTMYKFVIEELKNKGVTEKNILVSLERHMKCGVGKCGHCTIEHLYCCTDGPVFWLSRIAEISGVI